MFFAASSDAVSYESSPQSSPVNGAADLESRSWDYETTEDFIISSTRITNNNNSKDQSKQKSPKKSKRTSQLPVFK